MCSTPPVLFLVFNRPDLAERVFAVIRAAKPNRLYIASDGPRPNFPEEAGLCRSCRDIAQRVDWTCDVKTLFRDTNLGCKRAVSEAFTWFFQQEEEGIILEDDLVPDLSFFPYCASLLEKYRTDDRVAMIGGCNDQLPEAWELDTYYFSTFLKWGGGGATWRRSWDGYDSELRQWPRMRNSKEFRRLLKFPSVIAYWRKIFDRCYRGEIPTAWDYPWLCSIWSRNMLCIAPRCNLVCNIGFDERAVHTVDPNSFESCRPTQPIRFPLRHPERVAPDREIDKKSAQVFFRIPIGISAHLRRWAARSAGR